MRTRSRILSVIMLLLFILPSMLPFIGSGALDDGMDSKLADIMRSYIGEGASEYAGVTVADAGDVNGDGYADMLFGAYGFKDGGKDWVGKVYLFLGGNLPQTKNRPIYQADASFIGEDNFQYAGISVDGAGDVNGDGYDDLIIGASGAKESGTTVGKAYLIFGKASGWQKNVSLSSADLYFYGENQDDQAGFIVAGAGDVNGDGYGDILISARRNDEAHSSAGQVYIVFGRDSGWPAKQDLGGVNASFHGESLGDFAGTYASAAGDVNADGYDDFLISAETNDEHGTDSGQTYLIYGKADGWSMDIDLSNADSSFYGRAQMDSSGSCLGAAGDFDGDGFDDFMIGATGAQLVLQDQGAVFLVLGQATKFDMDTNLSQATVGMFGETSNDLTGGPGSCHGAGDLNGDKFDDLIIGSKNNDEGGNNAGQVYLVLGNSAVQPTNISVGLIANASYWGEGLSHRAGKAVSGGGDVDGDGNDDVLVGAPEYPVNFDIATGKTYFINPDANAQPSVIDDITLYINPGNTKTSDHFAINDTVYIQLNASGGADTDPTTTYVWVNSTSAYPTSYKVRLYETGAATNIFRAPLYLANRTRKDHDWLKVQGNETLKVVSDIDPTVKATSYILGNLKVMTSNPVTDFNEDETYTAHYWAENAPSFTWEYTSNAAWLSWNSVLHDISGTPDNGDVGTFWVNITVKDDHNQEASHNRTLTVKNIDPVINQTSIPDGTEDVEYRTNMTSSEDGRGTITWSISSQRSWLSIDAQTGNLSGTPSNDDVESQWVLILVDDGNGGTVSTNYTIMVENVNDPPMIITNDTTTAMEDDFYYIDYEVLDIDAADDAKWSLAYNGSWLSIDENEGILQGTPSNEDVGVYWVNVTVEDNSFVLDSHNFTLTVINTNDPPDILSSPGTTATALFTYLYDIEVLDVDIGDVIQYDLDERPTGMTIDPGTGLISWIPEKEQEGSNHVQVTVNDGLATTTQAWDITVIVPEIFPPRVTLIAPTNESEVNVTNPQLSWSFEDPDTDVVYFNVYLSDDIALVKSLASSAQIANDMTQTVFISKTELTKGMTYYWTVIPNDGESTGISLSGIWSFKIFEEAVITLEPVVVLNSPMDEAQLDSLPVVLEWSGDDPDNTKIFYDVYLGTDIELLEALNPSVLKSDDQTDVYFIVKNLEKNQDYFWTVVPNDGENTGKSSSGIWSFSVSEIIVKNQAPLIESAPILEAFAGEPYQYQVIASDPDGDAITFSLLQRPSGMIMDSGSGLILWNPTVSHIGDHPVIIRVSDGNLFATQEFIVEVKPISELNHPPLITSSPILDAKVGVQYSYQFGATDLDAGDTLTYTLLTKPTGMSIDASGLITWKPTKDQEGNQKVDILVSDGKDGVYQNFTVVVVKADAPPPVDTGLEAYFPWIILVVILIAVIAVVSVAASRRSKKDEEEEEEIDEGSEGQFGAGAGEAIVAGIPVEDEGIEDFDISEAFLIYKDGRLVAYSTTQETDTTDKELMSSMLIAIQGFVKESFKDHSGLDSFEFGGKKVVLVGGTHIILAAVLEGTEPAVLRDEIQSIIHKIEGLYAGVIESWDGTLDTFQDVTQHLLPLFTLRSKFKIKKKKLGVKVRSGIEFYSGYVRVKVGVNNDLDHTMKEITLTLEYDMKTLKLSHIEPDYPVSGSTIFLHDIEPKEKRTVAVYFDPIICQESHIDGRVTFVDPDGNPGEAKMKRKPVDIVCPIFYTEETVNVAMLKRLLMELNYNDSKIYEIPDKMILKEAYRLAVTSVKGHDVRFIREFAEEKPYEAESWFYGEVKETDEQIVIKVAANADLDLMEIFVASRNLSSMTGLLAELGSEFNKKRMERGISEDSITVLTDVKVRDAIRDTELLLDKYAESEIEAEETDLE